jgi:hypothetical protein
MNEGIPSEHMYIQFTNLFLEVGILE